MQRVSAESESRERERERVMSWTQTRMGAFGPGADPMRSGAAYPPPRLAVNFLIF